MRYPIVTLLGALLLLSGCSSEPATVVADTAISEAAKKFDAALEKAGFTDASVVNDAKDCAQYAANSKQRCVKWKAGAELVGYDSFYTISGCEVELKTDLKGETWKVASVNDKNIVLENSPTKDQVVRFIKNRNNDNPSPADDLCNVA